jgi:hypothetical protein
MQAIGSKITMPGILRNSTTIKTELKPESMTQEQDAPAVKKRSLQWVKGDKIGMVETIKSDDGQWLTFDSGGRISKSVAGEYMLDVAEGTLSSDELRLNSSAHVAAVPVKPVVSVESVHKQRSPVAVLLERSQQHDDIELTVKIRVKTPTALLMTVLRDSFGEEADSEVEEFVMAQVNADNLIAAAREELKQCMNSLG